jgi:hypothetical protein
MSADWSSRGHGCPRCSTYVQGLTAWVVVGLAGCCWHCMLPLPAEASAPLGLPACSSHHLAYPTPSPHPADVHCFTLANVLRRPLLLYGDDQAAAAGLSGVYLPSLWPEPQAQCSRQPLVRTRTVCLACGTDCNCVWVVELCSPTGRPAGRLDATPCLADSLAFGLAPSPASCLAPLHAYACRRCCTVGPISPCCALSRGKGPPARRCCRCAPAAGR